MADDNTETHRQELHLLGANADLDTDELNLGGNPVVAAVNDGTLKLDQLIQSFGPRGYSTDMDNNIFESRLGNVPLDQETSSRLFKSLSENGYLPKDGSNSESRLADKALLSKPLSGQEYFNRKQALMQAELEDPYSALVAIADERVKKYIVEDDEGNAEYVARKRAEIWARWQVNIENAVAQGRTLEEAYRIVLYRLRGGYRDAAMRAREYMHAAVENLLKGEELKPEQYAAFIDRFNCSVEPLQELFALSKEHYQDDHPLREVVLKGLAGQQFIFGDKPTYGYAREGFTLDLHLPFAICSFVMPSIHKGSTLVVVAEQLRENQILLTAFHKTNEEDAAWYALVSRRRLHMNEGKLKVMAVGDGVHKGADELYNRGINALLGFLEAQANKTWARVARNQVAPEAGEINLLDGYSVVYMSGTIPIPNESLGGTHASPREHERIGHWRRTTKGRVWIESMTVNEGVGGRVEKIYRVNRHKAFNPN